MDFMTIATRMNKGTVEIFPKFIIKKSSDLMIRGGDFYAIWNDDLKVWSTDEHDALSFIDSKLKQYAEEVKHKYDHMKVCYMWDSDSGMIDKWHKYCQKHLRDHFKSLDDKLIFSNDQLKKEDYASKKLNYPLEETSIEAYDELISVLYDEEERMKIEWAIGSIISGDSISIQKFLVLYGSAGTGKSTILNIIQMLFDGYYSVFDAKALGSANNSFALEAFKNNPLVAIQHDGDLSRIEDNTRLNSLVSHEMMTVNEKFKSTYSNKFRSFIFMGTNKPVKITDARSGLIRRLIDVHPTGNTINNARYLKLINNIKFELGGIAMHCLKVYKKNKKKYDSYVPTVMMGASNDFYNFMLDNYYIFKDSNNTTLKIAWDMYKNYCEEARLQFPISQRAFKEELKSYYKDFKDRYSDESGSRLRNYYIDFNFSKFENSTEEKNEKQSEKLIELKNVDSKLDLYLQDCLAQYANAQEVPSRKWDKVRTKLKSIDTTKIHYVKPPLNHIVIDFDIRGEDNEKSFDINLKEASKWPATYTEVSKSGKGIHLHYLYSGDTSMLSRVYDDNIEIKTFTGNSALRRKKTLCNEMDISTLSSGLPLKEKKMIPVNITNEKTIRSMIKRNLNKEFHPGTKPSMDFIKKILDDAYESGVPYDVSDMHNSILAFAISSTNQSDTCLKTLTSLYLKSEPTNENVAYADKIPDEIVFFDIEIFPNLLLINWMYDRDDATIVRMINPKPEEVEKLMRLKLVGFNNRGFDNHILYARYLGYSVEELYSLTRKIIQDNDRNAKFGEAYGISYTDVYDFIVDKKSLKKLQLELGLTHKELNLPWDQPVPEDRWHEVSEYCDNDVITLRQVFHAKKADFLARQILADLAGMTVNDTTNTLTTRIIFGSNRSPQNEFNYRNMGISSDGVLYDKNGDVADNDIWECFDKDGKPVFPGYKYEFGVSEYRGEIVSEGGYVYSEPGAYSNVGLFDIASQHPTSTIAEVLFGDKYTAKYKELVDARLAIKHKDFDKARSMLDGKLDRYLQDVNESKDLSNALKIAINSVYGLTFARFSNPFRDDRNKDNIVAKRGALFMINLKHALQAMGATVVHIKTDSVKVANFTPAIKDFIFEYGRMYGYTFEHEATYKRFCLVNDAVYIASTHNYGKTEWSAVGKQFQVPYVYKKLFSGESIIFDDLCEIKSVTTKMYLDKNENMLDVSPYEKELKLRTANPNRKRRHFDDLSDEDLYSIIEQNHNYIFVGRVGQFTPVLPNSGGGILYREKDGKYYSVEGTSGYRWLESEYVRSMGLESIIDISYHEDQLEKAKEAIAKYCDLDWFFKTETMNEPPCGRLDISCYECGSFDFKEELYDKYSVEDMFCKKGYSVENFINVNQEKTNG